MFQILLIILLLFIAVPILTAVYRIWRFQRRMRQFMQDPIGTAQKEAEKQQKRRSGARASTGNPLFDFFAGLGDLGGDADPTPALKKKKIPADVGEYVKFTEIKGSAKPHDPVKFTREEQVEDIEWEDVK